MTFQELATQADDMEITIACYRRQLKDNESTSSRNKSLLGGSEEKECPYSASEPPKILDKLLEKGLIELTESKYPKEIGRTNDPKYCIYHKIISHPIKKYKTFKKQVMQLAKKGKIILTGEDTEESN